MNQISRKKTYIILIAPVREGSSRPSSGWSEGETSPLKNIQHAAEEMMLQIENDMKNASAKLAAEQAERMVKDSITASMERIKNENESMRTWEENMVRRSGYHVDGKSIHRDAVVDSSLGHTYYEGQSVHYYEDFYDVGPKISVSFSKEMLNDLTSSAIMLLVEQANLDIENWTTDIFGKVEKDDEGNSSLKQNYIARDSGNNSKIDAYKKLAKKDYDSLSESEQNEFNDLSELIVTVRDGKLGEWIGYAPQFKNGKDNAGNEDKNNKDLGMDLSKGRDWNIKHSGSGQMGKIMLDFQWNNMIEQQGWQKVALPAYDQPLWRGNGSWFEPPTIRGISSIVFEVVGTASGQKWFSYADDVIFAAIDLGGGFKSAEQVGLDLAKTAATAVISMGCSAAGSAIGNVAGKAMKEAGKFANFAAQAGISMATSYATSVGTSFVNNWNLDADGKLAFDAESFGKSTYSAQTISAAVGAGFTTGLGELNLKDSNNIALNSKVFKTSEIKALNSLAGGLVQNGVSLAMGGEANFNILNFADIAGIFGFEYKNGKTGERASTGLLEISFGKEGFKSRIGMGGTNISFNAISYALGGLSDSTKIIGMNFGSLEDQSTLSAINMGSYTNETNLSIANDIWNGKKKVEYVEMEDNVLGRADKDTNTIYISDKLLGGGLEGTAQLTSMFSHEGLHIDGYDEVQSRIGGYDTYAQLQLMFGVTGEGYDSITDIAYMTEIYKEYGEQGVFTQLFFGDAFNQENLKNDLYLATVVDPGWRQSEEINRGIPLGNGLTEEKVNQYNKTQKELAYEKYKKEEYDKFIQIEGNEDIKYDDFSPKISDNKFSDEMAKKYGYIKADYSDLRLTGCTLSTAAYIAYSITGNMMSLQKANQLLKDKNIFVPSWGQDKDGNWQIVDAGQKNLLPYNNGIYEKAVNTLAQTEHDVVKLDSQWTPNSKNSLESYIKSKLYDDEGYFIHLRTNTENHKDNLNYHSVLLNGLIEKDMSRTSVPEQYWKYLPTIQSLSILDPWEAQRGTRQLNEIGRADAYKLTDYGRIFQNNRQKYNGNYMDNYIRYIYAKHNEYKYRFGDNKYGF